MIKSKGIGLCLGGGGARGIAHLGVIKALEEFKIPISHISGTSAGALAGCLYASGLNAEEIFKEIEKSSWWKIMSPSKLSMGLTSHKYIRKLLKTLVPENDFKSLKKDLFVCVTNITDGEEWIINSGNLYDSVAASCAIPVLFEPITIENKVCIDGGLLNNMPIQPLKNAGLSVIGININEHGKAEDLSSMPQIAKRSFNLSVWKATKVNWDLCDVKIDVSGAHDFGLLDFHKGSQLFDLGYEAALKCEKELKTLIQSE